LVPVRIPDSLLDGRSSFSDMIDLLNVQLAEVLAGPHVLFGQSMGAVIAYQLACKRAALGMTQPERLVVAACVPPRDLVEALSTPQLGMLLSQELSLRFRTVLPGTVMTSPAQRLCDHLDLLSTYVPDRVPHRLDCRFDVVRRKRGPLDVRSLQCRLGGLYAPNLSCAPGRGRPPAPRPSSQGLPAAAAGGPVERARAVITNRPAGLTMSVLDRNVSAMARAGISKAGVNSSAKNIGHFLQTRRARLNPIDVGMPRARRRRTPGLRREEVAVLAGVSVSWYTWLEQGRNINISSDVLASIGRALQLDDGELRYLFRLAGFSSQTQVLRLPFSTAAPMDTAELREMQALIDGWSPNPAFLQDRYWNVLAANEAAIMKLNMQPGLQNLLEDVFIFEGYPSRYPQGTNLGRRYAARLRVDVSEHPQDEQMSSLVDGLAANSANFQKVWEPHEVLDDDKPYCVQVELPGNRNHFAVRRLLLTRDHGVWMVVLLPVAADASPFSSAQLVGAM
jgi:transcriptional regulator with XRE-family HTH domain